MKKKHPDLRSVFRIFFVFLPHIMILILRTLMKKAMILPLLFAATLTAVAIPARRGLRKTITTADGRQIQAQLTGDEHLHYWKSEEGEKFVYDATKSVYVPADMPKMKQKAAMRRARSSTLQTRRRGVLTRSSRNAFGATQKCLVILVNFADKKFQDTDSAGLYRRIMNEADFSENSFRGSVKDYFLAQSNGVFAPSFQVYGPVTLQYGYAHYGANDAEGYDLLPEEMVIEACKAVDSEVDFSDYDGDGDGFVDQIILVYAGQGESSGGAENTVWPHEWSLSEVGKQFQTDHVTIDTYACSSELGYDELIDGIGTICHEFSHCLGLPDMYDTEGSNYGMSSWDLMDYGSYNGDGFVPAGYTSYERMYCGWLTPTVLTEPMEIRSMKPLSDDGEAYMICNQAHPDEYYLLENRQKTGWDAKLGGHGLLILHVDYDAVAWEQNKVNVDQAHQRCTIFHADNNASARTNNGDPYPYNGNDSLTSASEPSATLYHANSNGLRYMNCSITKITQNGDGTIAFNYRPVQVTAGEVSSSDTLFYESFDQCNGTGGNDGRWNGNISRSSFTPDHADWTSNYAYGADQCAKFGNSSGAGAYVTTPPVIVDGSATLTFKAAAWDAKNEGTTLQIGVSEGFSILGSGTGSSHPGSQDVFTMKRGEWTEFTATVTGTGTVRLTFTPGKRFFLDEVLLVKPVSSGIRQLTTTSRKSDGRIYSLGGQFLGTDFHVLGPGIYIIDGRKVVK